MVVAGTQMGSQRTTERVKEGVTCGQVLRPLKSQSIGPVLDPRRFFYVPKSGRLSA